MNLTLKTSATEEPVSLEEFKAHARIDGTDDEADATAKILAARMHVEDLTNRALCRSTWQAFFDRWPGTGIDRAWPGWGAKCDRFRLPLGDLQSDTPPIITYTDDTGTHTVDPSIYEIDYIKGEIILADGQSWPSSNLKRANPICIEFVAGKAAKYVKQTLKAAILLLAAHWYRNREAVTIGRTTVESMPLKMAVEALIAPDIIWRF